MSDAQHSSGRAARRHAIAFLTIYALHLCLVIYALPPVEVFGGRPWASPDYQTHYGQTTTLIQVAEQFGKLWAYDPSVLAGHPVGLIFDVDNKAHFLFTYALTRLGVSTASAFNLFTVVSCLLAPLCVWLTARLFRLGPREQLIALGLAVLLWHFDSASRAWTGGMISFSTVSFGALPVLALFYRLLERPSWKLYLPLLILLPLNLLIHVWTFGILVVPMVGLYIHRRRSLGPADHARVWGLATFAVLANAFWLVPALRHFALISPSGVVGQANPLYLFADWFELLINPIDTGFAVPHTLFRFATIAGMVLTLWRWRKEQDPRLFVALLSMGWLFGMAYCAALIPVLRETEPYRFIFPAYLLAAVWSAPWFARVVTRASWQALPTRGKVIVAVLLMLLVPRVVRQVVYFIPELRPDVRLPPVVVAEAKAPPTSTVPGRDREPEFLPKSFRLRGVADKTMKLATYVKEQCTEPGRFLVQHWAVAEFLRWSTGRPVIGGFPDRRLVHEAANIFRRPDDPRFWKDELANYLVRYNIRYLVMTEPVAVLEGRLDLFEPKQIVGVHRVYRVRHRGGYVAAGAGKVRAGLNRIAVTDARPAAGTQRLVLRFHHMGSLRCRPGCTVERAPIPHDPVGFIAVQGAPTLPERFVIEHHY